MRTCSDTRGSRHLCVFYIFSMSPVSSYFFFLMIRRPPRSTLDRSSAASDVYKRQGNAHLASGDDMFLVQKVARRWPGSVSFLKSREATVPVSYTHLRAHETVLDLVCRLLLEKKTDTVL